MILHAEEESLSLPNIVSGGVLSPQKNLKRLGRSENLGVKEKLNKVISMARAEVI